jgi:hypothetical protein
MAPSAPQHSAPPRLRFLSRTSVRSPRRAPDLPVQVRVERIPATGVLLRPSTGMRPACVAHHHRAGLGIHEQPLAPAARMVHHLRRPPRARRIHAAAGLGVPPRHPRREAAAPARAARSRARRRTREYASLRPRASTSHDHWPYSVRFVRGAPRPHWRTTA